MPIFAVPIGCNKQNTCAVSCFKKSVFGGLKGFLLSRAIRLDEDLRIRCSVKHFKG